jgi:hypothetical protein
MATITRTAARAAVGGAFAFLVTALAACSPSGVLSLQPRVDVGATTAAVPITPGLQSLGPSNPYMASYPRFTDPFQQQSEIMSADEMDCRRELRSLGVKYRDITPIHEGSCGIDHPVEVSAILRQE